METRRGFLKKSALGFGSVALASLMGPSSLYGNELLGGGAQNLLGGSLGSTHFPAKAKRVIYLFQSGGPSQLETFDYKPELAKWHGKEIPPSVQGTQRNSVWCPANLLFHWLNLYTTLNNTDNRVLGLVKFFPIPPK